MLSDEQKEQKRQRSKVYYRENKDVLDEKDRKRREYKRNWNLENPASKERCREKSKRYFDENKAAIYARRKAWELAHPEENRARKRRYYEKAKERILTKARKTSGLPEPTRETPELCECCGRPPGNKKGMQLDHCHETGAFRGWLCFRCNVAIGGLGDNLKGVMRAVRYLEKATC